MKTIKIGKVNIGAGVPFALIAGPCVIENKKTVLSIATSNKKIASDLKIPFIFIKISS